MRGGLVASALLLAAWFACSYWLFWPYMAWSSGWSVVWFAILLAPFTVISLALVWFVVLLVGVYRRNERAADADRSASRRA